MDNLLLSDRELLMAIQQQQMQQQQMQQHQQMVMHGHQQMGQQMPDHVMMHHVPQQLSHPQLAHLSHHDDYGREDVHPTGSNKRKAPSSPPSTRKKPAFSEHKAKRAEGPPPTPLWSPQMDNFLKEGLHQWGMKWEKVREVVQERFVQSHPCLHNPQLAAENLESTAIAEEMFSQISAEECEKRWSVVRKYLTNAQIAKTFPPWTEHEKTLLVNTVKHALEAPDDTTFVKTVNIGEQRVKTISWTNIAAALHRDIEDVNYQWNCYRLTNFKRGPFSVQEDRIIIQRYQEWSLMSDDLKPRTGIWVALEKELNREDKRISERWRSILSKRVASMQEELLRSDPNMMSNAMAVAAATVASSSGANPMGNNNNNNSNPMKSMAASGNADGMNANTGNMMTNSAVNAMSNVLQAMGPPLLGTPGLVPVNDGPVPSHLANVSAEQLQQLQHQLQQHQQQQQQQQQHSDHVAHLQLLAVQRLLSPSDAPNNNNTNNNNMDSNGNMLSSSSQSNNNNTNNNTNNNSINLNAEHNNNNMSPYSMYHHSADSSQQQQQQQQQMYDQSRLSLSLEQQQQQAQQQPQQQHMMSHNNPFPLHPPHFDAHFEALQQAQQQQAQDDMSAASGNGDVSLYDNNARKLPMVDPNSYVSFMANQHQQQMHKLNAAAASATSSTNATGDRIPPGLKDDLKVDENFLYLHQQQQQQQHSYHQLQHYQHHQQQQQQQHHHLYGGSPSPTAMLSGNNNNSTNSNGDPNSPNDGLQSLLDKAPSIRWNSEMDDVLREAYKRFESDWKQIAAYVNENMPLSARLGTTVDENKCRGRWYRSIRHNDDMHSTGSNHNTGGNMGNSVHNNNNNSNNLPFAHQMAAQQQLLHHQHLQQQQQQQHHNMSMHVPLSHHSAALHHHPHHHMLAPQQSLYHHAVQSQPPSNADNNNVNINNSNNPNEGSNNDMIRVSAENNLMYLPAHHHLLAQSQMPASVPVSILENEELLPHLQQTTQSMESSQQQQQQQEEDQQQMQQLLHLHHHLQQQQQQQHQQHQLEQDQQQLQLQHPQDLDTSTDNHIVQQLLNNSMESHPNSE